MGNEITVKNLSVNYGSLNVLRSLNFHCKAGEIIAIIGRSGSGKTTFLNALAGFIPYEGQIRVPKPFGYVFQQDTALFPWMTVRRNIGFGLGGPATERNDKIDRLLRDFDMSDLSERFPWQLSGGQRQRVAILRALANDPPLVLMDEPFGALDEVTRRKVVTWITDLFSAPHRTLILVSHHLRESLFIADRIGIIHGAGCTFYDISFPRPRLPELLSSRDFLAMEASIYNQLAQ